MADDAPGEQPGPKPDPQAQDENLSFAEKMMAELRTHIPHWERMREHESEVLEELEELETAYADNYIEIENIEAPELARTFLAAATIRKPFGRETDRLLAEALYERIAGLDDAVTQMEFTLALARRWHVWMETQRVLYLDGRINDIRDNPISVLETVLTLRGRSVITAEAQEKKFIPPSAAP